MGLTRTLQHNFFKQKYHSLDKVKPLVQNKFKKVLDTPLVRVLSKKGSAVPLFEETDLQQEQAQTEAEKDDTQVESDFFSGLFVETN